MAPAYPNTDAKSKSAPTVKSETKAESSDESKKLSRASKPDTPEKDQHSHRGRRPKPPGADSPFMKLYHEVYNMMEAEVDLHKSLDQDQYFPHSSHAIHVISDRHAAADVHLRSLLGILTALQGSTDQEYRAARELRVVQEIRDKVERDCTRWLHDHMLLGSYLEGVTQPTTCNEILARITTLGELTFQFHKVLHAICPQLSGQEARETWFRLDFEVSNAAMRVHELQRKFRRVVGRSYRRGNKRRRW